MTTPEYSFTFGPFERMDIEARFNINFSRQTIEREDIQLNDDESINAYSTNLDKNPTPSLGEFIPNPQIDSNEKIDLNPSLIELNSFSTQNNSLIEKKRKRKRKNDKDNFRKKIKRRFFNVYLINKLEALRKRIGNKNYFRKFPSDFVCDIDRNRCCKILKMSLRDIFEKEDFYKKEDEVGREKYIHNLKLIQSEEIRKSEEFKILLSKTIYELYEEYLNSDEFKIEEINYLKKKGENDEYIKKYEYLAKNLIKFLVSSINK